MPKVVRARFGDKPKGKKGKSGMGPPPPTRNDPEDLFGMAMDIIREELDAGSVRVATWYAEQYFKREGGRMRRAIEIEVSTPRELEEASQNIVLAMANGYISFEEGKQLQDALARHAVMTGMREIEDLKGRLADIQDRSGKKRVGANGMTPVWGRLAEKKNDA